MRFKKYLKEAFFKGGKFNTYRPDLYIEIFKNPSKREFEDAAGTSSWEVKKYGDKYVRFIIDTKKKDVFIWNPDVTHSDVAIPIYGDRYGWIKPGIVTGVASKKNSKWKMVASDTSVNTQLKWMKLDLSWAEKYISTKDYLED